MPRTSSETAAGVDGSGDTAAVAAAIEAVEARAWADLVAACPPRHAARIGLGARWAGPVLVVGCPGGGFDRGLFNRPIGLGVLAPATRAAVAEIASGLAAAGATRYMLVSQPQCMPADYRRWLAELGLEPRGSWDRVVRDGAPFAEAVDGPGAREIAVSLVGADAVQEWSELLVGAYRVDAGPWLRALHGRPGWRHYLAHERGRPVAARSMYLPAPGAVAFLAVDGPVPGVMTADHEPDAAILARIVADGVRLGAAGFAADIEAPAPRRDTPAYATFGRLGFRIPYTRTHHMH
jgi:hypothetical protein